MGDGPKVFPFLCGATPSHGTLRDSAHRCVNFQLVIQLTKFGMPSHKYFYVYCRGSWRQCQCNFLEADHVVVKMMGKVRIFICGKYFEEPALHTVTKHSPTQPRTDDVLPFRIALYYWEEPFQHCSASLLLTLKSSLDIHRVQWRRNYFVPIIIINVVVFFNKSDFFFFLSTSAGSVKCCYNVQYAQIITADPQTQKTKSNLIKYSLGITDTGEHSKKACQ